MYKRQLAGDLFGIHVQRALAGAVGDVVLRHAEDAAHRRDRHDAAVLLLDHHAADGLGDEVHALDVRIHDLVPRLLIVVLGLFQHVQARGVHQDVDAAELLHGGFHHRVDGFRVQNVDLHAQIALAELGGFGLEPRGLLRAARRDDQVCAVLQVRFGNGHPKAARAAHNERRLALQAEHVTIIFHLQTLPCVGCSWFHHTTRRAWIQVRQSEPPAA